ncbi:RNA12 protein-domain-containing protein [Phascolomyces articulosus]|uniref:Mitochondrial escape protein 2 n=1 Tax=Phascolomyces articulosus TaxID=60185 RepID=A0AAD5K8J4_9FUNG|nr:RNA12 protein-domain-containing protein [Phascolomyces articulosus]
MISRLGAYNGQQARLFCGHYPRSGGLLNTFSKPGSRRGFTHSPIRRQATQGPNDPVTGIPLKGTVKEAASSEAAAAQQEQTAMLYLDNVFPLRFNALDIRQWFFRNTKKCLDTRATRALPTTEEIGHGFTVKHLEPRIKDGGAIVEFGFKGTLENKKVVAKEIVQKIEEVMQQHKVVASFNLQQVRAFLVKGEPFLEDIVARYPTTRLRIEFQGEAVTVERLYKHLREYGKIYDIALYPNPYTSKEPARYAIVQFTRVRSATSARNCLHGHLIQGNRLNILYERQLRTNVVKEWVVEHPKITIPIAAAILAGLTYSIFDPMREFFIASRVTQRFNPEEYSFYRWLRRETWARLLSADRRNEQATVFEEDAEDINKIQSWLRETPETFVVVTGPRGSGKTGVVKAALSDRRNKIIVDCEAISNTRNQSEMIVELAKQIGYFPVFTWVSSLGKLLDTVIAASTGQGAGIASSPEAQIQKILESAALALRDVTPEPEDFKEDTREKEYGILDGFRRWIDHQLGLKSDKDRDPHDVRADIPVVVFDNFMHRESTMTEELWTELANFAGLLIENEVAHVVFVSSNVIVHKVLNKASPGRSFETIQTTDASPEMAMTFIARQLNSQELENEKLYPVVQALGGRLTELELLVQKLKMNMSPQDALEDIVQRTVIEIRKYGFNETADIEEHKMEWSDIQFWEIVKGLAQNKSVNFDELKFGTFFKGDEKPLWAMERAELITILYKDGRANAIRPGKPVMYTAFDRLVSDKVFAATMEIETNEYLKKLAEASIAKYEETVTSLSNIYNGRPPKEIDTRIRFLLKKIDKTQKAIEVYETRIIEAKQMVVTAWEDCTSS